MSSPLDELRRLDRERTPGEWAALPESENRGTLISVDRADALVYADGTMDEADLFFVTGCSRLVPVLLDRLDRLEVVKDAAARLVADAPSFFSGDSEWGRLVNALAALPSPAEEPMHLRDNSPYLVCSGCGRKSYAATATRVCGMPQPDGTRCAGTFAAAAEETR